MDPATGPAEICAEVWKDVAAGLRITKMVVVDQSSKLLEVPVDQNFMPQSQTRKGTAFCVSFLTI